MLSGPTQQMTFQSIPDGATVTVVKRYPFPFGTPRPDMATVVGVTPLVSQLARTADDHIVARFSKPGYRSLELALETRQNPWWWGNLLVGGFPGTTTDGISGAAGEYSQNQFFATLQREDSTPMEGQVSLSPHEQTKIFILKRHATLLTDFSRGHGEDLDALFSLLHIADTERQATSDRLRVMAVAYPDPLVFADRVISLKIAAK